MRVSLDTALKWGVVGALAVALLMMADATPVFHGQWRFGRLLDAGMSGLLGLVLLALRAVVARVTQLSRGLACAPESTQNFAGLPHLQHLMEFACHRIEATRLGQGVYVGDDTVLTVLEPSHPIYVDTRCRHIGPHLITVGIWEPQYTALFCRLLRPGQTVFDIGANHGMYAIKAKQCVGRDGSVHAFEPNPRLAGLITRSAAANGFDDGFTVHSCAVGETHGEAVLTFSDGGSGGGHTHSDTVAIPKDSHRITVPRVALDDLFPDPAFVVHAIKMDIEGAEAFALRGMQRLLAHSPDVVLLMEYSPVMLRNAGASPEEVINGLAALGFRFWTIREDGTTDPSEPNALLSTTVTLQNLLVSRHDPP